MDVRSNEAGQDTKRKIKGDNESGGNSKAIPGNVVEVVWAMAIMKVEGEGREEGPREYGRT